MGIFGKSRDASDGEKRQLANEWRGAAVETEVNAVGKSEREAQEAKSRAEAMRKNANNIHPGE